MPAPGEDPNFIAASMHLTAFEVKLLTELSPFGQILPLCVLKTLSLPSRTNRQLGECRSI